MSNKNIPIKSTSNFLGKGRSEKLLDVSLLSGVEATVELVCAFLNLTHYLKIGLLRYFFFVCFFVFTFSTANACSDLVHCWIPIQTIPQSNLNSWILSDILERISNSLPNNIKNASVFIRNNQPPRFDLNDFPVSSITTTVNWSYSNDLNLKAISENPQLMQNCGAEALVELDFTEEKQETVLKIDPFCLFGPLARVEQNQMDKVRYLALGSKGDILGIDEISVGASLTLDWNFHGFLPLGLIALHQVSVILGKQPLMMACDIRIPSYKIASDSNKFFESFSENSAIGQNQ
ncbi:MAG: hypothetical protein HQM08_00965 [Candidatus Riflebacteria bacterium]|nr:hypothetical protein [Candidatus Riflebacteria bacterium]